MYPGRKIAVWAHTTHISRNMPEVTLLSRPDYFHGITTMGEVVSNHFGNQAYALGFTAYNGWYGTYNNEPPTNIPLPAAESLEDLIYRSELEYAIIDFRNPGDEGDWIYEPRVASPMGYQPASAVWPDIMDGLMYIETMTRCTRIPGEQ